MNERTLINTGECGQVGQTLGLGDLMFKYPFGVMLVYISARPHTNDATLTMNVQDDGSDVLAAALAVAVAATPIVWKSKHFGGTFDPVSIAADSLIEVDFAGASADTRVQYSILFLSGEK